MQHRFAASVSLAGIFAIGFAGVVHAGPRLVTRTELDVFSTIANIGISSFEMIDITPFDSSLGILKEAEVRIAGTTEVFGTIPAGALPVGSTSNIELSQRFSGIAGDSFRFGESPMTTSPCPSPPIVACSIAKAGFLP